MTVVAQEAGVFVPLFDVVGREIQPVRHVLPIGNESRNVVVHGEVGVTVHLPPHVAQIPSGVEVGVAEVCEVEGGW